MSEVQLKKQQQSLLDEVPGTLSDSAVLTYISEKKIGKDHIQMLKSLTQFSDDIISSWLNVTVKTFRHYKASKTEFKANTKEQVLLLLGMIKHGLQVFETREAFEQWLKKPNFFFDDRAPLSYLNTISGIRFVDDRLTALEYGDNV